MVVGGRCPLLKASTALSSFNWTTIVFFLLQADKERNAVVLEKLSIYTQCIFLYIDLTHTFQHESRIAEERLN